ncbi:hypothetical protein ONA91_26365 [Micromonospora sp. DR5-3]|uniref:hypothetical protein n=1 Tax=Micromonospora sp. DR5-3 TaxID=2992129 RepID=UPI002231718E|nr:hypothetical protein [Micromonospora sp. DR5-3]MCW3817979.1 hypothetical protein [Micromonospora sp. DR5-3]
MQNVVPSNTRRARREVRGERETVAGQGLEPPVVLVADLEGGQRRPGRGLEQAVPARR